MKFKLTEDLLTEERYFKVVDNADDGNYFYMVATSEKDAKSKIVNREKHQKHEIYNLDAFDDKDYQGKDTDSLEHLSFNSLKDAQELLDNPDKIYLSSHRTLRGRAHRALNPEEGDKKSEYLVHHIDGNEINNDKSNLLGIRNTSKDYIVANAIHQMLHSAGRLAGLKSIGDVDYTHDCKVWNGSTFVDGKIHISFNIEV